MTQQMQGSVSLGQLGRDSFNSFGHRSTTARGCISCLEINWSLLPFLKEMQILQITVEKRECEGKKTRANGDFSFLNVLMDTWLEENKSLKRQWEQLGNKRPSI